jgi:hypothetical protein
VVVDVDAYGADPTGRTDSTPAVVAALRHAKKVDHGRPVRIVFSKGTYQLYPERAETRELYVSNTVGADQRYRDKKIGLLVEDMHDVTIDGGGAKLVYHGLQTAFASIRSTDVTFTNFSFDYAAPEVIDATVATTGVTDGHAYRVLKIPAGSPYRVNGTHITWLGEKSPATGQPYWSGVDGLQYTQIHDPKAQRTWRGDNPLFNDVAAVTDLGGRRIRIDYTTAARPADAGLVYQMRLIERTEPGAFIWQSKNVTMRSMNAYYLQSFGVVGQFSENISIDKVNFAPDPRSGRSTASFADFVQMSGVKGKVSITRSVFDGPHDDPINIHGTYLEVVGKPGPSTLTLAYKHPQTAGFPQFAPGDEVEFTTKRTMTPLANGAREGHRGRRAERDGPRQAADHHDRHLRPAGSRRGRDRRHGRREHHGHPVGRHLRQRVPQRADPRHPGHHPQTRPDHRQPVRRDVHGQHLRLRRRLPVVRVRAGRRPHDPRELVHAAQRPGHLRGADQPGHRPGDSRCTTTSRSSTTRSTSATSPSSTRRASADSPSPATPSGGWTDGHPPYTSPLFVFHGSSGIRIAHNRYDKGLNTSVVTD